MLGLIVPFSPLFNCRLLYFNIMTPKKTYSDKLKDPRWQKKRLDILQRDEFTCVSCGDKDNTLHVHHKYYTKGADVWDYPDKAFVTLCEDCHQEEEKCLKEYSALFIQSFRESEFMASDLLELACAVKNISFNIPSSKMANYILQTMVHPRLLNKMIENVQIESKKFEESL